MKRKPHGAETNRNEARADAMRDNAIDKLVALFVAGELAPGNFSEIIITHEASCQQQRGPGSCDCDPRFQIIRPWMVPRKTQ